MAVVRLGSVAVMAGLPLGKQSNFSLGKIFKRDDCTDQFFSGKDFEVG